MLRLICRNTKSASYNRIVTPDECNECVLSGPETIDEDIAAHGRPRLLDDGVIAYPKRGWEPPAVPAGYRRKSDDLRSPDAWTFIPILPPCKHRVREIDFTHCGNARVKFTCSLTGSRVTTYCNTCENRDGV